MKARILPAVLSASILLPGQVRPPRAAPLEEFNSSLVRLAEKITPAVVLVVSNTYRPIGEEDAAAPVALQPAAGSGVILSPDGCIVTNAHVVAGASRVRVQLPTPESWALTRKPTSRC